MRAPSAREVVRAWEVGEGRPDWFRALLLLSLGAPQASFGSLARLSLGQRNSRVAALRRAMFGEALTAVCPCPRCGAVAEFAASVADLAPGLGAEERPRTPFLIHDGGAPLTARAPTSEDLAELEASPGDDRGTALALRCVETGSTTSALAVSVVAEEVMEGWYVHDPGVETAVDLTCGGCGEPWTLRFDWPAFTWAEVASAATRLMQEAAALSRAFGWRESDVLEFGPARRRFYLRQAAA